MKLHEWDHAHYSFQRSTGLRGHNFRERITPMDRVRRNNWIALSVAVVMFAAAVLLAFVQ